MEVDEMDMGSVSAVATALQILSGGAEDIVGRVASVVQRIQTDPHDDRTRSKARRRAARALKLLAQTQEDGNASTVIERAVRPLIAVLSTSTSSGACDRADAAFMLGHVACGGPRCSQAIARTGVVRDLVRLMSSDGGTQLTSTGSAGPTAEEREMAAYAVAKLARESIENARGPTENAGVIDAAGGLRPLIRLLEEGTRSAQEYAAEAIWSLARERECCHALVRFGCVRRLLALLRSEAASARAKANAAHALGVFGIHKRIRRLIVQGGAIEALTDIMRYNVTARIDAANTLGIISSQLEDASLVGRAGAIPLLISFLFEPDRHLRAIAADNLCVISSSFSDACSITNQLMTITMDVSRSWEDRAIAVDSIWDLATYSHCVSAVGASGVIPHLVSLLNEEEQAASAPHPPPPPSLPSLPSTSEQTVPGQIQETQHSYETGPRQTSPDPAQPRESRLDQNLPDRILSGRINTGSKSWATDTPPSDEGVSSPLANDGIVDEGIVDHMVNDRSALPDSSRHTPDGSVGQREADHVAGKSISKEEEEGFREEAPRTDMEEEGEGGAENDGKTDRMPDGMRESIAGAFAALSSDEDNRMAMVEAGVIPLLARLLRSPLEDVRDSAAEALYHLSIENCYRSEMIRAGLFEILSDVRQNDGQELGVRVYHFARVIRRRLLWAAADEKEDEEQDDEEDEDDDDDDEFDDDEEAGEPGEDGDEEGDEEMDLTNIVDMECDVEAYYSFMTGADFSFMTGADFMYD